MSLSNLYIHSYKHPRVHFSPQKGWSNDPNGCIYFKGKWHLFFQHYPDGITWGPMHWGHAISNDLICWEEQPIALYPDEHGYIFSGSAVYDRNNVSGLFDAEGGLVLMFTYAKKITEDYLEQAQSIAYSPDGITFHKYEGNPVILNSGEKDFRDPRVFKFHDCYYMVIAVGDFVRFYRSYNLLNWEKCGEFGKEHGCHGGTWECPDIFFFEVDTRKICMLKVSVQGGHPFGGSGEQLFFGDFTGETFVPFHDEYSWLDMGPDIYASQLFTDTPDGKPVLIGWMNNIAYLNDIPADDFRGSMTLPRKLSLLEKKNGYTVCQEPLLPDNEAYTLYHETDIDFADSKVHSAALSKSLGKHNVLDITLSGIVCETLLTLALSVGEKVLCSIEWNVRDRSINVKRNAEGLNCFSEKISASLKFQFGSELRTLRCLIDTQSAEFFINEGELTITLLLFREKQIDMISTSSSQGASIEDLSIKGLRTRE